MTFSLQELKTCLLDPFPIAVACGNWIAITYSVWGEKNSGTFHFVYESLFTQVLFLLNFPSLIAGTIVGTILAAFLNLPDRIDFLHILSASLISGVQWFLIGKGVQALYSRMKSEAP